MDWFYNMSIKKKLLTGFSVVSVLTILIGYLTLSSMQTISENGDKSFNQYTLSIASMGNISTTFQRIRINVRDLQDAQTASDAAAVNEKLQGYDDQIKKYGEEYSASFIDKEDENNFKLFTELYGTYHSGLDNVKRLINEEKKEEAHQLIIGEMKKNAIALTNHIDKMVGNNIAAAKKVNEENITAFESSRMMNIALIVLVVVFSIGIGIFISGYIARNIAVIVDRLESLTNFCITNLAHGSEQLAEGDLNVNIQTGTKPIAVKSKDEIGVLGDNINTLIVKVQGTVGSVEKAISSIRDTVKESTHLVEAAVNGKLSVRGNTGKFKGSYKELISGLNDTFDAVVTPIEESSRILAQLGQGDLTARMDGDYKGDYVILKNSINKLAIDFGNTISEVLAAVSATASASTQISSSTEEMAAGAQEQSAQTTEVASAIEEMTKTIVETAANSVSAADTAKNSGRIAKEGGSVVKETVVGMGRIAEVVNSAADTVKELGKSSDQIGEIVQVIDDIADQTNLLALNAAIEAARAGEQGRGFAVVADEVRKLAERTTKATKEIATMIKQIQKDTLDAVHSMQAGTVEVEKGMELAEKAGVALDEIIGGSNKVVDMVNMVAAAGEQQSATAEQISRNIDSINGVTQESAAGIQQIARAAEDLNRLTENLQNLVSRFTIETSENSGWQINRNAKAPKAMLN